MRKQLGVAASNAADAATKGYADGVLSSFITTNWPGKGYLVTASAAGTLSLLAPGADGKVLKADSSAAGGLSWVSIPHDVSYMQTIGTRTVGLGDNVMGIKLQRAVSFVSVTFRCGVADASGNSTFELRKNGTQVSGTSTTVAAANQVAGGTSTGTWAFSAGDILTVYCSAVGTTPGTGLVADITGVVA